MRYSEFEYVVIHFSFLQLCYGFYGGLKRPIPGNLAFFGILLLFWLMANWIVKDAKVTKVTWVCDSMFAFFIAWPFLVPAYLFRTRGIKAFKEILCFMAFGLFFHLLGRIVGIMTVG